MRGEWKREVLAHMLIYKFCMRRAEVFSTLGGLFPVSWANQLFLTPFYTALSVAQGHPPRFLFRWRSRHILLLPGLWITSSFVAFVCSSSTVFFSAFPFFFCLLNTFDPHRLQFINHLTAPSQLFFLTLLNRDNSSFNRIIADLIRTSWTVLLTIFLNSVWTPWRQSHFPEGFYNDTRYECLRLRLIKLYHAYGSPHSWLGCGGRRKSIFLIKMWLFQDSKRFLIVYLKPVRRFRHDVDKMDTAIPCVFNNIIISVNNQVVTYQETVETGPSGCPPINELLHNIAEEFYREISLLTLKV